MTSAITLRDVNKVYERRGQAVPAVQNVTMEVPTGSRVSLIGPSGCGKSTILRIVTDLVAPTSGDALVAGVSPSQARAERRMALVSQQSTMLPWRRLQANVELGLEVAGMRRDERRGRAQEALELVGLADFADAYPHELSGGMRQRGAIARALTLRPQLLVMDEPFGALDELSRETLNFELLRILAESDASLLLVTHSIPEAVILSDTVFVMSPRPGTIVHEREIPLGHHREASIRDSAEFAAAEADLRHHLVHGHGEAA